MGSQGTQCRRNIAENLNPLSRAHEHYRQTDDRQTTDRRTGDSRSLKIALTGLLVSVCMTTVSATRHIHATVFPVAEHRAISPAGSDLGMF